MSCSGPVGRPSSPVVPASSSVALASSPVALASSPVALASSPVALAFSSVALAFSSVVLASATVALPSSTVVLASATVALTSSTVALASLTVVLASSTVALTSPTVALASSSVALPSSTVGRPSSAVACPSSSPLPLPSPVDPHATFRPAVGPGDKDREGPVARDIVADAYERALLFAMRLGHRRDVAADFAQAAILRAIDPNDAPWRPGDKPDFASHVCNLLYSAHGNASQSYEAEHREMPRDEDDDDPLDVAAEGAEAEAALDDERRRRHDDARYALLMERIEADPLLVLFLASGSNKTSTERALEAGYSLHEIKLGRERLAGHIAAVNRQMPPLPDEGRER
jgi:hypothetical protein